MTDAPNTNLFEVAARKKFRFPSPRNDLTVEQLYDLPLTSPSGFDLDSVAKAVNAELKDAADESFVITKPNPRRAILGQMLELVKIVIADKVAANERAAKRAARAQQRQLLLDAIGSAQQRELGALTPDQLQAKLAALDEGEDD